MIVTLLKCMLETNAPWSVSAPELAAAVDRPLARDTAGRPAIPVSSLAGSLREHLRRTDPELALGLMGPEPPVDAEETDLVASPLRFLGTATSLPEGEATWVLRQTAVDRHTGAAKSHMLRTTEVAPAGTTATLYLRLDRSLTDDERLALAAWQPGVGGGRSIGLGSARVVSLTEGSLDLDDPVDVITWITNNGPNLAEAVATHPIHVPRSETTTPFFSARARIVDGILIADEARDPREEADAVPWTRGSASGPVIEGSTFKGVVRARAELILASLGVRVGAHCAKPVDCPLNRVFGYSGVDRNDPGMRSRLTFRPSEIRDPKTDERTHVAIDRVTGGAHPGLLFVDKPVLSGEIDLVVDSLDTIPDSDQGWVRHLLALVVQDMNDGYLGLGSRTTRGLGTLHFDLDDEANGDLRELLDPAGDAAKAFWDFVDRQGHQPGVASA